MTSKIAIVAARSPAGSIAALFANLTPQAVGLDLTGLAGQGEQVVYPRRQIAAMTREG